MKTKNVSANKYLKDSEYVYFLDKAYEDLNRKVKEHIKDMSTEQIEQYLDSEEYQKEMRWLRILENYGPPDRTFHIESRGVKKIRGSKEDNDDTRWH